MTTANLCLCGCGNEAKPGRRYYSAPGDSGHDSRHASDLARRVVFEGLAYEEALDQLGPFKIRRNFEVYLAAQYKRQRTA